MKLILAKHMKRVAWNILEDKNHSFTSSCGILAMIYEAEVISVQQAW